MQIIIVLFSVVSLVAVDQLTKFWALTTLKDQMPLELWPGVFEFRYSENTGVAFSMLENQRWLFIPLSLLLMAAVAVMLFRSPMRRYKLFSAVCVLILAGGIGNLIDRTLYGYVVDFLYFRLIDFPIFNFADCCVVIGGILLFVFLLFIYKEEEALPMRTLLFGIPMKEKKSHE